MGVDVGDRLGRIARVPGRLTVVVDVGARDRRAGAVDELVVAQVARQPDLDLVVLEQQPGPLLIRRPVDGRVVRVGVEAGRETLDARVGVERATSPDGVAESVAERPDAAACQLELSGLAEPCAAGDLTEVPSLAVDVDALAVDAVVVDGEIVERRRARRACWRESGAP